MRIVATVLALGGCGRFGFSPGEAVMLDSLAAPTTLPGLVAHYAMNDDPQQGTIASDQLPTTCASASCPTGIPDGRFNGAYHFDGSQSFDLPSSTVIGITPYTVSVWLRLDAYPDPTSGFPLVAKPADSGQADAFNMLMLVDKLALETTPDGSASDYARSAIAMPLSAWHHACVSWDGTTKRVYQDSSVVGSETSVALVDSTQGVSVGVDRDNGVPAFHLVGSLDELQIYNRALSEQEIKTLAQ